MQTTLIAISDLIAPCRIRKTDNSLVNVLKLTHLPQINSYIVKLSGKEEWLVADTAQLRVVTEKPTPQPYAITRKLPILQLPPLVSFQVKVCMDTKVHLPSTWKEARGKELTNRKIAEYQREGRYGSALKLPAIHPDARCVECNSNVGCRKASPLISWLPIAGGIYCKVHWALYRSNHEKQKQADKELAERIREQRAKDNAERANTRNLELKAVLSEYC